jgi:hypothetical protein
MSITYLLVRTTIVLHATVPFYTRHNLYKTALPASREIQPPFISLAFGARAHGTGRRMLRVAHSLGTEAGLQQMGLAMPPQ